MTRAGRSVIGNEEDVHRGFFANRPREHSIVHEPCTVALCRPCTAWIKSQPSDARANLIASAPGE
jgi:hypothetical protein